MTTERLVSYFTAGLTIEELSERSGMPVLKVEKSIRRWMIVYTREAGVRVHRMGNT